MNQELFNQMKQDGRLEWDYSYPGGAYYSHEFDCHYNRYGQELRDISEYDVHSEGYTPFGDE